MKVCKDCTAEGITTGRAAPHPGPRCQTHHRIVVKARRKASHEKYVQKTYGLADAEYDALLKAQGNVCALCRKPFVYKKGSVDHCHTTEKALGTRASIRGVIHAWENTIIGRFGDDPEKFEAIAEYLRNPPARHVLKGEEAA